MRCDQCPRPPCLRPELLSGPCTTQLSVAAFHDGQQSLPTEKTPLYNTDTRVDSVL